MATLKKQVLETIKNNALIQQICFYEIDDGTSSPDNTPEDDTPTGGNTGGDSGNNESTDTLTFDSTDPNLAFFNYTVNEENKTVEVAAIDYQSYYDANGTYDIVVPATLGNYPVVMVNA